MDIFTFNLGCLLLDSNDINALDVAKNRRKLKYDSSLPFL
jgi:hypothetical protein